MCDIIIRKWDPVSDRVITGRCVCRRCKEQFFYRMMLQIVKKMGQWGLGPEKEHVLFFRFTAGKVIKDLRTENCLSPGIPEGETDGI